MALKKPAIFTADTNSLHTKRFYQCYQFFVHFGKNHFCDLHGIFVCYTKSVYKSWFHAYFVNPAADFLATAMNDDRFESDQFQKYDVFDDICLQFFIQHGTSAIFYHYDLTVKTLDIRECFNKSLCLVQIFLIYHFSVSSVFYSVTLTPAISQQDAVRICNLHLF